MGNKHAAGGASRDASVGKREGESTFSKGAGCEEKRKKYEKKEDGEIDERDCMWVFGNGGRESSQKHQIELQITVSPEMIPGPTESLLPWKRHHRRQCFNPQKPVKLT